MRKNYGKVEDRLNYTEIVCIGIKTKDHSDFMNELNLRMILWSTAEAVLRPTKIKHNNFLYDPLVYCGSGTETTTTIAIIRKKKILWSTAEAVLRHYFFLFFSFC